jgi:hypothetical protein
VFPLHRFKRACVNVARGDPHAAFGERSDQYSAKTACGARDEGRFSIEIVRRHDLPPD